MTIMFILRVKDSFAARILPLSARNLNLDRKFLHSYYKLTLGIMTSYINTGN